MAKNALLAAVTPLEDAPARFCALSAASSLNPEVLTVVAPLGVLPEVISAAGLRLAQPVKQEWLQ